jgi:hypothetical protein
MICYLSLSDLLSVPLWSIICPYLIYYLSLPDHCYLSPFDLLSVPIWSIICLYLTNWRGCPLFSTVISPQMICYLSLSDLHYLSLPDQLERLPPRLICWLVPSCELTLSLLEDSLCERQAVPFDWEYCNKIIHFTDFSMFFLQANVCVAFIPVSRCSSVLYSDQ